MPRIYRTQKEIEQFLIREFLRCLDYRISSPKWEERPDALLTLNRGKIRKRVGIEHTAYFNNTVAGMCSPTTPIAEFWRIVQSSLIRRISHRKHLGSIEARVKFKSNLPKSKNPSKQAKQLAKELVAFVEAHPVSKSNYPSFCRQHFSGYPTLESLICSLLLFRRTDDAVFTSRCSWMCSNISTGNIGLNLRNIKTDIENKNKKAVSYNWGRAKEKWLLIAAAGNVSNHAGGPIQDVNWTDTELLELCRNSPFDRIVFWERHRCWCKWLKPNKPIVELPGFRT